MCIVSASMGHHYLKVVRFDLKRVVLLPICYVPHNQTIQIMSLVM
jgi:hypothetical protein